MDKHADIEDVKEQMDSALWRASYIAIGEAQSINTKGQSDLISQFSLHTLTFLHV